MTDLVTLAECPPGLFRFGETIGFKTEYGAARSVGPVNIPGSQVRFTISNWPDAYCVDSGETFWGGASTDEARAALLVEPIDREALAVPASESIDRRYAAKLIHDFYMHEIRRLMHQAQHWHDEGRHPLAVHHRVFAADEFFQVACRFDPGKRALGWGDPFEEMERTLSHPALGVNGKDPSDGVYPPSRELHAYRDPRFTAAKAAELCGPTPRGKTDG